MTIKPLALLAPWLLISACSTVNTAPDVLRDITMSGGNITGQYPTFIDGEGVGELFDDSLLSKYLSKQKQAWVQFESAQSEVVKAYSLTSANDAPARDPVSWSLLASEDGNNWHLLHQVERHRFDGRTQTKRFELDNQQAFRFYRLDMTQGGKTPWGDEYLQLADIGLYASTKLPLAGFTQSQKIIAPGEVLTLTSTSKNAPTAFTWYTPGGVQRGSGEQIQVSYAQPGVYGVNLQTQNRHGSDFIERPFAVKVLDPAKPWLGFKPPKVTINFEDQSSEGAKRLMRLMPDLEADINAVTHQLVKRLYKHFAEVPDFEQVEFQLKWMDTLAYRAGSDKKMVIAFSSKYITERLQDQADEQVRYELLGVLWHELVHGYQLMPLNRSYGGDPGVHAYIEGVADLVRIQAGYHKTRTPKRSDSWLGGYTNTGFFLHYLATTYEPDFAYKFNQSALTLDDWSFEKAIQSIIGKPIDTLWADYQQSLPDS